MAKRRSDFRDLTGKRFGNLVIVDLVAPGTGGTHARWLCRCDCGGEREAFVNWILAGKVTCCGCQRPKTKNKSAADFWRKVNKNGPVPTHVPGLGPCWLWTGDVDNDGYGRFNTAGRGFSAHRFAYIDLIGDPGELLVCHKCDNRLCVRTQHHFLGNTADNTADMLSKGRGLEVGQLVHPGESNGSAKLTDIEVLAIRARRGTISNRALGRELGVNEATIRRVLRGAAGS